MGQCKDHMEVRHAQKFFFACFHPTLASLCLALWTVAVSAGIIGDGLVTAFRTGIDVAAQCCRAATSDGTEHRQLLKAQPWILFNEAITLCADYIGHLNGGPCHSGLCFLRERSICAGFGMQIFSSGFAVA